MPDASASDMAPWFQALSTAGFATVVYLELREHRKELKASVKLIARLSELVAVLLDRDARPSAVMGRDPTRPVPRVPTPPPIDGDDDAP